MESICIYGQETSIYGQEMNFMDIIYIYGRKVHFLWKIKNTSHEYEGRYEKEVLLSCVDVSLLNIVNEVIYILT